MIGSEREIVQDFNNFGRMLSMPMAFDVSIELRMVKMSSLQHETLQSSDGKGVDEEKLNDTGITDFGW